MMVKPSHHHHKHPTYFIFILFYFFTLLIEQNILELIKTTKNNYKLRGQKRLFILPISDLHIGSQSFNEDYFYYMLDRLDEIKSSKRIYLCGDLIEAASKNVGNSSFHTTMSLDEQLDTVINIFKPYRKDIHFSCIGNHEARLNKDYDLDIMRIIAKPLKCQYGYQNMDTITVNGKAYTIYMAHGKGTTAHHYTAESKFIRETQTIKADLLINGHNHRVAHFSLPHRTSNGIKRRHYCFTGAFLRYTGYPDSMMLPVLPESFIHLSLSKDLNLRSNIFYIDERAPEYLEL